MCRCRVLVDKFSHMRFEPSGFTKNPDIPMAKSIMDYIFRWLASKFLDGDAQQEVGVVKQEPVEEVRHKESRLSSPRRAPRGALPVTSISSVTGLYQQDAPPCPDCGAIMIPQRRLL